MERDRVQLVRSFAERYTAAWCSHDAASVAAFYEENGLLSVNEDAPAVGRDAITEVAQGWTRPKLCSRLCDDRPIIRFHAGLSVSFTEGSKPAGEGGGAESAGSRPGTRGPTRDFSLFPGHL
jgi:hypothetical protein